MPALDSHRIFLSAVTAEFGSYRTQLAERFERVSVKAVSQGEFEYDDTDLIEKLYRLIRPCHVVIHFVGAAAGAVANPRAVEDFLRHCQQRGDDFLGFWKSGYGVHRSFFDQLTYTQWEAVIAVFLKKSFIPLQPMGNTKDGHPPGKAPFTPCTADADSQTRHLAWLTGTIRRHPQCVMEMDGSYLADAFAKVIGFLLREGAQWQQTALQLQALRPSRKIAPSRIQRHAPELLFGRELELAALDAAWAAKDRVNIYTIVAWGGTGKTSLVAHWVRKRLVENGWPGVDRYFDWSFYSQGTGESRQTSSDLFMSEALRFFGDPDPTLGSPWERGERLADFMRQHHTLLVLDGIEPLQYPPNDRSGQAGSLKDQGLESLLQGLAQDFAAGLCLITTRESLANLQTYRSSSAPEEKLDMLSRDAGIALLRHLQITGTEQEMEAAWKNAGGHALTLQLLGRFIADAFPDRDIRHYHEVRFEEADLERQGRSAFKVMRAYETWLQRGDPERQRELAVLRLTGLFDRPIRSDCLNALRAAPAIAGLTDSLTALSDRKWNTILRRLQAIDLISLSTAAGATTPESLDAHPLIREYFAKQLREQQPEAFREAHSRVFDHLCKTTDHQPDTLEGLQPLYQAVVHGCQAGRQQEARGKVFRDRILRSTGNAGHYSLRKLGAIGMDLGALTAFFDDPWSQPSPNLSETEQAWVLGETGFRLRALGRISEARQPLLMGLKIRIKARQWEQAAATAINLSDLESTQGLLGEAIASARRAIEFADRGRAWDTRLFARTTAADALHQSGSPDERTEAHQFFTLAETLQQEHQPHFPQLYSVQGFQFCDLILAPAEGVAWAQVVARSGMPNESFPSDNRLSSAIGRSWPRSATALAAAALAEAERRGNRMLEWRVPSDSLIDIALDHLTLARVAVYRAVVEAVPATAYCNPHLEEALNGLRKAGHADEIPHALLTSALHHHMLGDAAAVRRCLDEAQQIAERGPMPLYLADVHLHRARLFRDKAALAQARVLIDKHGYGRRREELADAEAASVQWQ